MARRIALVLILLVLGFLIGRLSLPKSSGEGETGLAERAASQIQGRSLPSGSRQSSSSGSSRLAGAALQVSLARAEAGALETERRVAGTVVPARQVNVAAQVGGVVARIFKAPGDRVAQGEAVVQLDTANLELALKNAQNNLQSARINLLAQERATAEAKARLEAQLAQAQAAYEAARRGYEAAQKVHALGGSSESELAQARAALDQARANLEAARAALAQNDRAQEESLAALRLAVAQAENGLAQAQLNLKNATLRAPFAGEILAIPVEVGAYLPAGGTGFTLAQGRRVQFSLPPEEAALLPVGSEVGFEWNGEVLRARVDQNPGGPASGTALTLTARLEGGSPPLGAVGGVRYRVRLAQGVIVPLSALVSEGNALYVFVAQGGRAHRVDVQVLGQAGDQAAVKGLEAGAQVVVNPPPGLLEGSLLRPAGSGGRGQGGEGGGFRGPGQGGGP